MLKNSICIAASLLGLFATTAVEAEESIKIGYAIARTGPFAGGAQVSQEPNYLLWAEQVNARGGLMVAGKQRKVELVGYDDRSDTETVVRTYEKLMNQDQVDLVLPPWGTGQTFAVATLANRLGYPMIAPTATSKKLTDMKLPYVFTILQQPAQMMNALADMLVAQGVKTAAVVHIDDLFGLENADALSQALASRHIQVVEKKSYPLGVKDLSPVLKALKEKQPDAFLGITYPPDTILVSKQAKQIGFNPKVFYAAVGTAFPLYKAQLAADTEGVMGMGSWNAKTSAAASDYFAAHLAKFQKEPDRWASAHAYASLQVLQQAVEKVGLDRSKIRDAIANDEFQTILGPIRFKDGMNASIPGTVGQWQKGEFEVVWPSARATAQLVSPKPVWH